METALLLLAGANWGVTRSTVRVSERRGISIVKIVIITTAAFLAMLSVAAPWGFRRWEQKHGKVRNVP